MARKDESSYTWIFLGGAVVALLVISGAIYLFKGQGQDTPKPKKNTVPATAAKAIRGGTHESSGVAAVPGTDQVLFVDDRDSTNIYSMTLGPDVAQVGDTVAVKLGVEVEDPEDITFDGTNYYVVGSQFRKGSSKGAGLVRFTYDPTSRTASNIATIDELKDLLVANVPELEAAGKEKRSEEAINIEGLGWDPASDRLLLGFRNPLAGEDALVVPVLFKDPAAAFSADNISFGPAIKLSIGGQAVRSLEYDPVQKLYLIVAGAPEGEKKSTFSLWTWDGTSQAQKVRDLDDNIKPEGITRVVRGSENWLLLVGDAGYYMRLPEGGEDGN